MDAKKLQGRTVPAPKSAGLKTTSTVPCPATTTFTSCKVSCRAPISSRNNGAEVNSLPQLPLCTNALIEEVWER